jgi:hypothetical protein
LLGSAEPTADRIEFENLVYEKYEGPPAPVQERAKTYKRFKRRLTNHIPRVGNSGIPYNS